MHPRRSEPGQRGLTLIEVLVALAIVAITLAAGIKAAGALTGNTQRLARTLGGPGDERYVADMRAARVLARSVAKRQCATLVGLAALLTRAQDAAAG
ncbi:type II secretion system protein, partial [Sphaerotilus montanus]|uniref:type II secretion system protein n=1 Tax=Sphaerotilus montanus TaxID=522889 RepID=UPI003FA340E5